MLYKMARYVVALLFGVTGYVASYSFMPILQDMLRAVVGEGDFLTVSAAEVLIAIMAGLVSALIGWVLSSLIIGWGTQITRALERLLYRCSGQDLLFGTFGLAFGLIIANLIGLAFRNIPIVGPYIPVVLSAILGYLGMHLMVNKRKDVMEYWQGRQFIRPPMDSPMAPKMPAEVIADGQRSVEESIENAKLLDTSVVIDGRIGEICHTGFLEGTLVAPLYVLEELQKISDSADTLKRNRGRRGLDMLQAWQEDPKINVVLLDEDYEDLTEVDSKLMRMALDHGWKIITNDFNLNKVATLQGIGVLNLNDLANAMKPVRAPGETMTVQVVKAGKENGQGIAYLEDGTMIVVENGMPYLHDTIPVVVTSILQTRAGRMIFAKPEGGK